MTKIPTQRAVFDRLAVDRALMDITDRDRCDPARRQAVLAHLKQVVADGRAEVDRRLSADRATGVAAAAALSFQMDQMLRVLVDLVQRRIYPAPNPTEGEKITLVAIGGYGRGELAPFSDIDLLFLLPHKPTAQVEQLIEFMLYMLWDLGFKVGQAARSIDECLARARNDTTIRTSLVDARYICGNRPLFDSFRNRFRVEVEAGTESAFIEAKLAERDQRHDRHGSSRYVLEPNIKDGKGGLRDLHTLYWIAKALYRTDDPARLADLGVLTPEEAQRFAKARQFLWSVRFHLHAVANRAEERLTFDLQPALGRRMGYAEREQASGVERFMKHYFLVAKDVGDLTRIFCAAMEADHRRRPRFVPSFVFLRRQVDGFPIEDGRLTVADARLFETDPVAMIRLFHTAQANGLEVHPNALRLVTRHLKHIDAAICEDPEANRLFLDMLTHRKDPETGLRRLSEAGVFGRFVPDFGRVVAQMQYDMYHVYTVDEHTIFAIGILAKVEQGLLAEALPIASEVVHKVLSRRALYVAVFLHDIAKGRPGDHSIVGADLALSLCPRFGLDREETETVSWLVRWHLLMSRTAFKRDLDDPKTISDFVDIVRSPERLRLLLVLTVCDIRAVGPKTWTPWKAQLLRQLYRSALALMQRGFGDSDDVDEQARMADQVTAAKQAHADALADWPPAEARRLLAGASAAYWLGFDTATHVRHARLLRTAERTRAPTTVDIQIDGTRGVSDITVIAPDEAGLLPRMAGALAAAGATILDARVYTLAEGLALDSFTLQDADGGCFDRPPKRARLAALIEQALDGSLDIAAAIARRQSALPRRTAVFTASPRVLIDNAASHTHTLIEVNGTDRPGFLWRVTRAIADLGLKVGTAKISTFGETAVDVFYVKDRFGMKIVHPAKLQAVRDRLLAAIADTPPASRATAPEQAA